MRMPDTKTLDTAIAWLTSNEGSNGEAERCKAVAAWIEHEERERQIRSIARTAGVTTARVRRKMGAA